MQEHPNQAAAASADQRGRDYALFVLAAIVLVGLAARLVFFAHSLPFDGAPYIRDEGNYVGIAVPLSQGQGYVDRWVWLRPPGYPVFLAAFLLVPGGSLSLGALVQVLLSTLNVALIYPIVLEVFGFRSDVPKARARLVGLAAATLMAVNPHLAFYTNLFMPETLYTLAATLVVWALLRVLRVCRQAALPLRRLPRRALALVALAGLVSAGAVLMRSLFLLFTPLLLAWFWWLLPREAPEAHRSPLVRRLSWPSLVPLVLFGAVMFATIAPWTVRNYVRYDRFLLVDTMAGYNLWQYNDTVGLADIYRQLDAIPNPVDREQYAREKGTRAILSDIPAFLRTAAGRFLDEWPVDHFSEFRLFLRDKFPGTDCLYMDIFAWLGTGFYIPFVLLGIWGFAVAPGRAFKGLTLLVLAHYALSTMLAHAEFRYRIPLYPFASVYAGWAVVRGLDWTRAAARRRPFDGRLPGKVTTGAALALSFAFVALCVPFVLPGLPRSLSFERRYLGGLQAMNRGEYAAALGDFQGAAELDKSCACLYRKIGQAHGALGQADEERAAFQTAIKREELDWRTRALLSDRLRAAGDARAADIISLTRPEFRTAQLEWAWDNLPPPPAGTSNIDVGGADIGYVAGFASPESETAPGGAKITFRWTTGAARVRLWAPPGASGVRLVVRQHSLAWAGKPEPEALVRVRVDGREQGTFTAKPGWAEAGLDLSLNGAAEARPYVIELLTPAAIPPGGETRLLGIAVDEISLERK